MKRGTQVRNDVIRSRKVCPACLEDKPLDAFYESNSRCKKCHNKAMEAYRLERKAGTRVALKSPNRKVSDAMSPAPPEVNWDAVRFAMLPRFA